VYVVALCGLHGTGKSFISCELVKRGWFLVNKRKIFRDLYIASFQENDSMLWEEWYRKEYELHGGDHMMRMVLDYASEKNQFKENQIVVVDAVHNMQEWRFITETHRSTLVLVIAPKDVRYKRLSAVPDLAKLDMRRLQFVHETHEGQIQCLYGEAGWSICNAGTNQYIQSQLNGLIMFVTKEVS